MLITGCALTPTAAPKASAGSTILGNIHGGQEPIAGAHVYLLAAGTTGYGSASTSLLTSGTDGTDSVGSYVLSDANGSFSVSGDYTCTPNTQVYFYALGGDPGAGDNPAAGLMSSLGNCPSTGTFASAVPFVSINEVTTIAAAYAFSSFAIDATHVGSSGTALAQTGIANAFGNTANLADLAHGAALATTPAGNGTVPQSLINTLANILAACINSAGSGSTACTALFANAMSAGSSGTAPTDTATAAINIAHNPATNVAALFSIPTPAAPFAPSLATQPADFTIAIDFTGAGITTPTAMALDASGNLWAVAHNNLAELSPLGAPLSPSSGFTDATLSDPYAIAIDNSAHLWIANYSGSSLTEFDSTGALITSTTPTNTNYPTSIAIDPTGNLWIANYAGDSLNQLTSTGAYIATSTGGGLHLPFQVLSDATGNLWVPDPNDSRVALFHNDGSADISSPFTAVGLAPAFGNQMAAIDSTGNLWVANQDSSLSALTSSGAALSGTPYNTGTSAQPSSLAIDGQNNLFEIVSTFNPGTSSQDYSLLGFNSSGTPLLSASGHPLASNTSGSSLVIDGSGNLWLSDSGYVTEIIGVAAPVATPSAAAVSTNRIATRP
jgi:streptogramin lyase